MALNTEIPLDENRRWRFDWVLAALFQPRWTFRQISAVSNPIWHTPIAVLTVTTLLRVLVTGSIKEAAAATGQITYPPGFEYYTPEQQAQFQQALNGMNTPTFHYLLPGIVGVLTVLVVWLVVGWLLHLALTLRGGRGSSQQAINVAAWAGLPFAMRDIVRVVAMMNADKLIGYPGLSGFAPADGTTWAIFATAVLTLVDLYLIWYICLLVYGMRLSENLSAGKTWVSVLITMLILLALRALPAVISAQFQNLTVIRPFF